MAESYFHLALAIAAALFAFFYAFASFRKARLIEDTPTSVIRSAPQGYVELIGMTKPDQKKLKAPLTAQPCLWYEFKVEKHVRSGKKSYWRTVRSGDSDTSFYLEDDTGLCHVHPEGAQVIPSTKQVWFGNSEIPDTAPGVSNSIFSARRYRYTEKRIHEGQLLYALGLFHSLNPASASEQAKEHMAELLHIWKMDRPSLLRQFDTNRDGEIDQGEWTAARAEAARLARAHVMENYDSEQVHTLKKPDDRSHKFIISTKSPEKLVKRFKWHGWGAVAVFLVALGVFAHLLNQLFLGSPV